MIIKLDLSALTQVTGKEYFARFLLGGAVCAITGLIAARFGAAVGGLFLAFPAIFPASATLVESHECEKKRRAGILKSSRGRLSAALDARGACMGAVAMIVFARVVSVALPDHSPAVALGGAMLAWLAVATSLWRLRRWHTRFWIRRGARRRAGG